MATQRFRILKIVCLISILAFLGTASPGQQPIVVELFTSEGCSSCPPADALLVQLRAKDQNGQIKLILLGEHVDYWDGLGWHDRFSSPLFTQRQYEYTHKLHLATAYTPQLVIDGHLQTVGSDVPRVQRLLVEAVQKPKPAVVNLELEAPNTLRVTVTSASGSDQQVLLALTEDNLRTNVSGGENGGRVLSHAAVTREFRVLGRLAGGHFDKVVELTPKPEWKRADLRVVVLVCDRSSGEVLGSADSALSPSPLPARN